MKNHGMGIESMRTASARAFLGGALLVLFFSVGSFGCEAQSADPTGGETHFLRLCDPDGAACGSDLACICGVCTSDCSVEEPCSSFAGAQCVAPPPSCAEPVERSCDVHCGANEDCWVLSDEHYCIDGWCRFAAEIGAQKGTGGAQGELSTGCEPSGVTGNEVVVLGDSFFATTHEVTAFLEAEARASSVLALGERYRDYSNVVSNSLIVSGEWILGQYQAAQAEAPVNVVIMNGGGADVLIGACDPVDAQCPAIADAASALGDVFAAMDADGVEDVIFVSYPDPQLPEVFEKMEVLRPLLEDACQASAVPCTFLDLRLTFDGKEAEYILEDGLNPTSVGSQVAAAAIWQMMEQNCIAQ